MSRFPLIACSLLLCLGQVSLQAAHAQGEEHGSYRLQLAKATQLATSDNPDGARNLLEKITREYPDSPEAYNNLAVLAAYSEEWSKAIDLLEQAISTDESLQTSYHNLNQIYRYQAAMAYRAALPDIADKAIPLPDLTMLDSPAREVLSENPVPETAPPAPAATVVTAPDLSSQREPVQQALARWANAWSSQDIDAYLASYMPDYVPEGYPSHQSWRKLRRERVLGPSSIRVSVANTDIDVFSGERAMLTFTQTYQSPAFTDTIRKLIVMENVDDAWMISAEHVLR